jgi:hypothetical protein
MRSLVCEHLLDAIDDSPRCGTVYLCVECRLNAWVGADYVRFDNADDSRDSISVENWYFTTRPDHDAAPIYIYLDPSKPKTVSQLNGSYIHAALLPPRRGPYTSSDHTLNSVAA